MSPTPRPANERSPRLLLVRPDHLGDVLLTLPAVTALRGALPAAELTYLAADGLDAVPARCPAVDRTLALPFPAPDAGLDVPSWRETVERAAPALRGRFDAAVLLRPNDPWSGLLVSEAGIPVRVGYPQPGTLPFLTHPVIQRPLVHDVDLALDLVEATLGVLTGERRRPSPSGSPFEPLEEDDREAAAVLASSGAAGRVRPFVLHPGAGWNLKLWAAERWAEVARSIADRVGVAPLVTGGRGEAGLVQRIVDASGGVAIGLAGRLSIGGLAALMRRARLVIATDSGPLHLAALVGAPVVGLYGPADPRRVGPVAGPDRSRIVRVQLPCSPCHEIERPPCGAAADPLCVTSISASDVVAAALDLLDGLDVEAATAGSR